MQLAATRLSAPDRLCWIYFVPAVTFQAVLASHVIQNLSMFCGRPAESRTPRGQPDTRRRDQQFHQRPLSTGLDEVRPLDPGNGVLAGWHWDAQRPETNGQILRRVAADQAVHGRRSHHHGCVSLLGQPHAPSLGALDAADQQAIRVMDLWPPVFGGLRRRLNCCRRSASPAPWPRSPLRAIQHAHLTRETLILASSRHRF